MTTGEYPLYHITRFGVQEVPIYNCNFCPYDTSDMAKIDLHIAEGHPYDERGNRMNLRGEQYSNFDGSPLLKNMIKEEAPVTSKSVKEKE